MLDGMKKKVVLFVVLTTVASVMLACGSSGTEKPPGEKQFKLTISGGTIGGSSNLSANLLAALAKKFVGMDSTVIINPSMAQTSVVQEGVADVSTCPTKTSYNAYYGKEEWNGKPWKEARMLTVDTSAPLQIFVLADSPIKSVRDLKGKNVSPGKKGFSAEDHFRELFLALGMDPEKDVNVSYMEHSQGAAALLAGKLDAYMATGDPPHPTLAQADLTRPIRIVNFTAEEVATISKAFPYYNTRVIEKQWYKGMPGDSLTSSHPWGFQTSSKLPEDVAYNLTKAFWDNPEFNGLIKKAYELGITDGMFKENVATVTCAPYHVGAYKYYKEKGFKMPDAMIPPEAK